MIDRVAFRELVKAALKGSPDINWNQLHKKLEVVDVDGESIPTDQLYYRAYCDFAEDNLSGYEDPADEADFDEGHLLAYQSPTSNTTFEFEVVPESAGSAWTIRVKKDLAKELVTFLK